MAFDFKKKVRPAMPMSKPITTLIEVTGYKLEGDPKDHRILGVDLENRDENGVPKQVEVAIQPFSEKGGNRNNQRPIPKPKDFAEWVNTKTEIGGTILISRATEAQDGTLVADYAQRVAKDKNWVRQGNNGVDYKVGCQAGYIKVSPAMDKTTGKLKVIGSNGNQFHKAFGQFYPDNAHENIIPGGPGAGEKLKAAAEQAIDSLPDPRATPLLMLFQDGAASHEQILIKNSIKDPQTNQWRDLTREEMKQELANSQEFQDYMTAISDPDAAAEGIQFRTRNGFGLTMLDRLEVNEAATEFARSQGMDGPVFNKTRVEKIAPETLEQHRLPKSMKTNERPRDIRNRSVFVHGYVSYEIPSAPNQNITLQKVAKTLSQNWDQQNSLNGGITQLRNPHFQVDENGMYVDPGQQASQAQTQETQQSQGQSAQQANHQAAMAAQAPIQGNPAPQQPAQQPAAQQRPAQQAPTQAAASNNYGQPEPMPEPPMPSDDEVDQFIDDQIPDFGMDEFEDELNQMDEGPSGPRM